MNTQKVKQSASDWMPVSEVARHFNVHPTTVYHEINAGHLPAIRIGRTVRVSRKAVEDYKVQTQIVAAIPTEAPPVESVLDPNKKRRAGR